MTSSISPEDGVDRRAHPLPPKIPGWEPLHLTFRHAKLPDLPVVHDQHVWNILQCQNYEKSHKPSGHSIKTLAWMGDAVLYLASTKACLRAGVNSGDHKQLQVSPYGFYRYYGNGFDISEHSGRLDDKSYILIPHSIISNP